MKPIIGILADVDENRVSKMNNTYARAIEAAGGLPILLPYVESAETVAQFVQLCDGFLFSGGADVHPCHYREEVLPCCGNIFPYRDDLELRVFAQAFSSKKPILGICRGIQLLNVALGGTLYQDIPSQRKTDLLHRQADRMCEFVHEVNTIPGTPLSQLVKHERMQVNSIHHQALKDLGKGLAVMAMANDGIIEAVYLQGDQYLRGVQWHPERLIGFDETSRMIIADFVSAC